MDAICIRYGLDGRWLAYPLTVLVERRTLWITALYANWAVTCQWGTSQWQWETLRLR